MRRGHPQTPGDLLARYAWVSTSNTPHAATDRHDQLLNGRKFYGSQGKLTFDQAAKISSHRIIRDAL
jgi:hypothetical protein